MKKWSKKFNSVLVAGLLAVTFASSVSASSVTLDTPVGVDSDKMYLVSSTGESLEIDSITIGDQVLDSSKIGAEGRAIVRNEVLIRSNATAPLFFMPGDSELYYYKSNLMKQSYNYLTTAQWYSVSYSQQLAAINKVEGYGYTFANKWVSICSIQVNSVNPVSVSYSYGNGRTGKLVVDNGYYDIIYTTNDGESAVLQGVLTYLYNGTGTASFTGGINFKNS